MDVGMKPFRFGVTLGRAPSRAAWVDKARQLEALGYAVLTVPDHLADFFAPFPAVLSDAVRGGLYGGWSGLKFVLR